MVAKKSSARRAPKQSPRSSAGASKSRKSASLKSKRSANKRAPLITLKRLAGTVAAFAILYAGLGVVNTALSSGVTATGSIKGIAGKCLTNKSGRAVSGNPVVTDSCRNNVSQEWSVHKDGTLRVQGLCLDVASKSKRAGAVAQVQKCDGTSSQKWLTRTNLTLVNDKSRYCLSVKDSSTVNNATVRQYYCYASDAQKWTLPSAAPVNTPGPTPTPTPTPAPAPAPGTGNVSGPKTNQTFQTFTSDGYTSRYHLYVEGVDWSKPVGALIYADGSGEYGLKNPNSTYLLSGSNGLIAVAKRHNMILLTPFAPNTACADGDGSCWYMGDSVGYTKWAESLVHHIYSKYPIDKSRVAFGGYSSGAQLATEWWVPSGAAQRTMTDGVVVAISYGGSPRMKEISYSSSFKSNVHLNWNTGSADSAYTTSSVYGVKSGYNAYTKAGFSTSLDVIQGLGHNRSGAFGGVMDAQIREHVKPAANSSATSSPTPSTPPET